MHRNEISENGTRRGGRDIQRNTSTSRNESSGRTDHTLPSNAFQPVWKQDCIMRCSSRGRKDLCIPGSVYSFPKIQSIVIWIFFYVRSESAYCDLNIKHCIAGSHPKRIYTFFITGFIEERNHICPYPSSHPKRERTFCM